MTTELTLTIDAEVAKKMEAVAQEKNTSVSQLTEKYYESLIAAEEANGGSWVSRIAGIIKDKNVSDEDLDKLKWEYLSKKNGL